MDGDTANESGLSVEQDVSVHTASNAGDRSPNTSQTDGYSDEVEGLDASGSSSFETQSDPELARESSPSPQPPERVTYSVGDHVFFETSASGPYQLRRIDEFTKNGSSVDAKVFIYSRKSDLPSGVQKQISGFMDGDLDDTFTPSMEKPIANGEAPTKRTERRLMEHFTASREAFLNKDDSGPVMETLPTSLIRGKCSVLHHVEGPPKCHYTDMENAFFYNRAWYVPTDLQTGEVVVDREKQIHYDSDGAYQATIPPLLTPDERMAYEAASTEKASLVWLPNRLSDLNVANFVEIAVAVSLMARSVSVESIASLAVREDTATVARIVRMDGTILAALDLLHECDYDLRRGMEALVGHGLWSKRMLLETFDDTDMSYFRIGLHETGRNLKLIHDDWLPWRSYADIVGFYYLFKSTSYYREFRNSKAGSKHATGVITCVSIGQYESRSCLLRHVPDAQICYGCYEASDTWYAWSGLARSRRQVRALCATCWDFWKRYACLKRPWKAPPGPFRANLRSAESGTSQRAAPDAYHCISPKPTVSTGKQLLITHRASGTPSAPLTWTEDMWVEEKSQADEEEFAYSASDEWRLARRLASESAYDPRQLARYPLLACGNVRQTQELCGTCPSLVVNYYRQRMGRRPWYMDSVISKLNAR